MHGSLTTTRYPDSQLWRAEIISEGVGSVDAGALGSKASLNITNIDGPNADRFLIHSDQSTAKQELDNVLWTPAIEQAIDERCDGTKNTWTCLL